MNISDEAVEAAAKAHYELGLGSWEGAHEDTREVQRDDMRAALEAAAPYLTQPRTITTVEDLDALPFETVIRDGDGFVLERWGAPEENGWVGVMVTSFIPPEQITLPAIVIHEGVAL